MKKTLSLAFTVLTAVALFAGCAKTPINDHKSVLELSSVSTNETKAVIDGTIFPQDGHIGLFLFKDESAVTPYGDTGCSNVEYSYNGDSDKWTANPPITVGGEPGHLYGYYPYNSAVTDIKAIPVSSSLNGDDVMYATKQTVTDETASQTAIKMNHALACVSITVVNNGYTLGKAELSSIKFSGAETSVNGILDATSGIISGTTKADVTLEVPSDKQSITAEGTVYECLLVPSEEESLVQTLDLTLNIDGDDKTTTLSGDTGVTIARNTKSNVTIALSNTGISVQTVSIEDWNVVEVGGHKVTVKHSNEDGIANDVFLDVTSNGSAVTIRALAATGKFTKCTCTPDGKATCNSSTDETTGICTFTISDVQEDITAEVGYLKYNATVVYDSDMGTVKVNGNVVDSDTPVQILYGEEADFTAEANTGYGFVKWTNSNDETLSTDNPYTISHITSDITLNAVFGYQITADATPAGAGTVTGAGFYPKNSTATLTATAGGSGWTFIGWAEKDSPETIISTNNPYSFTVSGPASYVAVFELTEALPGLFTVDVSGTKVRFSKGNLWCDGTGEGYSSEQPVIKSWGFESNQYDSTPTSGDERSINHISHFMWCKSASESVKETYSETDTGTNDKFFTDYDDFAVNGVSSWRTLTGGEGGEWKYLLNTRKTTYGTGELSENNRRYAAVKVNGMAGLLIFPDDFSSWPSGAGNEPQTFNTNSSNWNNNLNYTKTQFEALQTAGCVFLPAAGSRNGNSGNYYPALVYGVGIFGCYWSASPNGYNNAYGLHFSRGNVTPNGYNNRNQAYSVRLVTECQ